MALAGRPPAWFTLLMGMPYGRYRLLHWLQSMGALERTASVPFHARRVVVPLDEYAYGGGGDLGNYQVARISRFASICDDTMGRFDFVDCGAHLGLFAAQFAAHSSGIRQLTSIEPNRRLFPLTELNLQGVQAAKVCCVNAAVSDFEGRGRLVAPDYDPGTAALYLAADPAGEIDVITLSSVLRNRTEPCVAIKVDVEGQEVPVLSAAAQDIRALERVVLFVELHRKVLHRIGMSDVEMMEKIDSIRPLRWINADDGASVDPQRPIFDQTGGAQCDLIGISR